MKKGFSLLLAVLLCVTPAMASQSGDTISVALSQMGYTEGARELTKYGQWYGIPNGYWCDMFVSWCARQAGLSADVFPSSASCTQHYHLFKAKGQWQDSLARGGNYEPRQGDLIIFRSAVSGSITHIGYVLYVENGYLFTVEGNTLTNRMDYPANVISPLRKDADEPPDYVTVNLYPLVDSRLFGYATPAYSSREPLELTGYVDLSQYADWQPQLTVLAETGILPGTSSHTFSPRLGMGRGAFVKSVVSLCGLSGWAEDTPAFADAPQGSAFYEALMTARSAGLIEAGEDNLFNPSIYISGPEAQEILTRARAMLGLEDKQYEFGPGDLSYILTPYTTRIDLAKAFYDILSETGGAQSIATDPQAPVVVTSEEVQTVSYEGGVVYRDQTLDWPVRTLEAKRYVPLPNVLSKFPELSAPGLTEDLLGGPVFADVEENGASTRIHLTLEMEGRQVPAEGFLHNGTVYVPMEDTAKLLGIKLQTAQ